MTWFVLIAVALVALSLVFVLPPLLRPRSGFDVDRAHANRGVLEDQLAELEAERVRGAVDEAQYAEIKAELERRVLEDVQAGPAVAAVPARSRRLPALVIGVLVPVVAAALYVRVGDPAALDPGLQAASRAAGDGHMSGEQLEQMVKALRQRLEREPDNAAGWSTLAGSYYQMGRFDEAAKAFSKLVALVPEDANLLADYADALAMAQGRTFEGKPRELVARALQLDPTQWKALAMAGTDAFEQGDFKGAVARWEQLRAHLPPDSPLMQSISGSIAMARQRAGLPNEPAPVARAAPGPMKGPMPQDDVHKSVAQRSADKAAPGAAPAAAAASVAGIVTLSPALKAKTSPNDVVFIFARPAQGSRMPLALKQVQVKDLPAPFTLDDAPAMSPNSRISDMSEVIVGARISKSGSPMPASGDLEGLSRVVKVGTRDVAIMIDTVVP